MFWSRGRQVGGRGGGYAGGEEGMWAVGVVGTLLWVVNAVKAQNQTEQEGAPPNADPGGSADKQHQRFRMHFELKLSCALGRHCMSLQ